MSPEEETAAWAKLEASIESFLQEVGDPGLLLDWVLVTYKIVANADGSNQHMTSYTGAEHQPNYRTLGLLEYASHVVRGDIDESRE